MPNIPFNSLVYAHQRLNDEVIAAISSVLQRSQFVLGPEVEAFELEYAAFSGSRHCVAMGNGLDALHAALKLAGVGEGDEVIVPAHTYIASWMAASRLNAMIVPVDVQQDTMLIDPGRVAEVVTSRTKAIMPVHLYGQPCDMARLMAIAESENVPIIEDNAQAHGARFDGRPAGRFGLCNAASFYPTKNLGALGDGGALTTDDEDICHRARAFRNYGSKERFVNETEGTNSRLDELQAAVLRVKLRHLNDWNLERQRLADTYFDMLEGVGDLRFQAATPGGQSVYHLFVIRTEKRDALQIHLKNLGIETAVHYPIPPHLQKVYAFLKFGPGDFPVAEQIAKTAISLPLFIGMKASQVEEVCRAIKTFYL